MSSLIPCRLNHFNASTAKNPSLLPGLREIRHRVWPLTNNQEFDKIVDQRLFKSADSAVKHYEDNEYESSIAMCATAAEMLTYFLFFVHTNSFDIPTENDFLSQEEFKLIRDGMDQANQKRALQIEKGECEKIEFNNSFSHAGNQSNRVAVLRSSKITKQDYNANGEGHDSDTICQLIREIRDVRTKYLHHWRLFSDNERQKDAEKCIYSLYDAMGHTFEMDASNEAGVLKMNASILKWMNKFLS